MNTETLERIRQATPTRFEEKHIVDVDVDPTRTLCGLDANAVGEWVPEADPTTCIVCAELDEILP